MRHYPYRMSDFKSLEVWQVAHELTLATFRISRPLWSDDGQIVRKQLLRAAISIPANIAEGSGKQSDADFVRFLRISMGSTSETEYHLILAVDLELIKREDGEALIDRAIQVRKMLSGLIKFLQSAPKKRKKP